MTPETCRAVTWTNPAQAFSGFLSLSPNDFVHGLSGLTVREQDFWKTQLRLRAENQAKQTLCVTFSKGTELLQGYRYLGKFGQVCLHHPPGGLWKEEGDKQISWLWAVPELEVMLIQEFVKYSQFQAREFSTPFSNVEDEDWLETTAGCSPPACHTVSLCLHPSENSNQGRANPKGSSLLEASEEFI